MRYILECISRVESAREESEAFDALRSALAAFESSHHLLTGIPLPGHPIDPLILDVHWPSRSEGSAHRVSADDLVINKAIDWRNFFVLKESLSHRSALARAAGLPNEHYDLMIMPVDPMYTFQAVLVFTFAKNPRLHTEIAMNNMSFVDRTAMRCLVTALLIRLRGWQRIGRRKGELSSREKEAVTLASLGKTAGEMSDVMGIGERTVISHLKNASAKLHAANRTECVIQAIRYNQIGVGSKTHRGQYEIETEILSEADYNRKLYF